MPERRGRYYAINTGERSLLQASTPRIEDRTALLSKSPFYLQQNAELKSLSGRALWLTFIGSIRGYRRFLVAEIAQLEKEGEKPQPDVLFQDSVLRPLAL